MNSTRSPSLDRSSVFFPLFFCLVSKIPLTSPARLSNISYVDKLSQLIRGGSRVPRSKRADKRTFAADESRQILAPWNTIDRLQPLRLIAFEPWFNRVYTYTGCGFYTSRCVFLFRSRLWKLPVKIEACRATLSGWYVRTRRKGGLSKRCFRGRWSAHRSAKETAARATLIEYRCFDNSIFMYKWRVHVRSRIYREQEAPSSLRNRATRSPILALYCTLAPLSTFFSFFSFLPSFRGILGKLRERAISLWTWRVKRSCSSKSVGQKPVETKTRFRLINLHDTST